MFQKNINNMQTSARYTTVFLSFDLMTKDIPYYPQEPHDWCTAHFSRRNKNQKQN